MASWSYIFSVLCAIVSLLDSSRGIKPVGFQGTQHVTAEFRKHVTLNCTVGFGFTKAQGQQVYWRKVGEKKLIQDHRVKNGSLRFKAKKKHNKSSFECLVKNNIGTVIVARYNVTVLKSSKIDTVQLLAPQEAHIGGQARLECQYYTSNHIHTYDYTWTKDDETLDVITEKSRYSSLKSGQILQIHNLKKSDEGEYRCTVWRGTDIWLKKSRKVKLNVGKELGTCEKQIIARPQTQKVNVKELVVMECLVNIGTRSNKTWKKQDGHVVSETDRFGNILLTEVSREDNGTYICTVTAPGCQSIKLNATLSVFEPPRITQAPSALENVTGGGLGRFCCLAEGYPTPRISWYKNGELLYTSWNVQLSRTTECKNIAVGVSLTTFKAEGYYQCVAENDAGVTSAVGRLSVYYKAGVPSRPKVIAVKPLRTSEISISLTLSHVQSAQWLTIVIRTVNRVEGVADITIITSVANMTRNLILNSENSEISSKLKPATEYMVFILAFDKQGASHPSEPVKWKTFEAAPSDIPSFTAEEKSSTSILVKWAKLDQKLSNGVVTKYMIEYDDDKKMVQSVEINATKAEAYSYILKGLTPDTKYKVRVKGRTSVGYPKAVALKGKWKEVKTHRQNMADVFVRILNRTAVLISWNYFSLKKGIDYYTVELQNSLGETVGKKKQLLATTHKIEFYDLDKSMKYKVSVLAVNQNALSGPVEREFSTSDKTIPPPYSLEVIAKDARSVTLSWKPVTILDSSASYQLRYISVSNKELSAEKYLKCLCTQVQVEKLKPDTKYEFQVRAEVDSSHSNFSESVMVTTMEDVPCKPEDLEWSKKGAFIQLKWKLPKCPNGRIIGFIIDLRNETSQWKSIEKNESATSHILNITGGLKGKYYFKIRAVTSVGPGPNSDEITVDPEFFSTDGADPTEEPIFSSSNKEVGIIIGVVIGVLCIIICISILLFRNRCCRNPSHGFNGSIPHCHGNGHIANLNGGHTRVRRFSGSELELYTSMLTTLPENAEADSKGGGHLVLKANGVVIPNGVKTSHVKNGHLPSFQTNHGNVRSCPEEQHGLLETIVTPVTDVQDEDPPLQNYMNDSLEDIDRSSVESDTSYHRDFHANGKSSPQTTSKCGSSHHCDLARDGPRCDDDGGGTLQHTSSLFAAENQASVTLPQCVSEDTSNASTSNNSSYLQHQPTSMPNGTKKMHPEQGSTTRDVPHTRHPCSSEMLHDSQENHTHGSLADHSFVPQPQMEMTFSDIPQDANMSGQNSHNSMLCNTKNTSC